jgi:c-di-GMP-binding flagellar brake protein YcgR
MRIDRTVLIPPDTSAVCKNISAGGMLVETPQPLEQGKVIDLEVTLFGLEAFAEGMEAPSARYAGDLLHVRARVLRVLHSPQGENWYNGLQFVDMSPDETELMDKFVTAKAAGVLARK